MNRTLAALAIAAAGFATAPAAHADAQGPTCRLDGTVVVSAICLYGHPAFTGVSVSATATGAPGATVVRIAVYEVDQETGAVGPLVVECSDASADLTDTTAACSASVPWSGAGMFYCRLDGMFLTAGTCSGTVEDQ